MKVVHCVSKTQPRKPEHLRKSLSCPKKINASLTLGGKMIFVNCMQSTLNFLSFKFMSVTSIIIILFDKIMLMYAV